MKNNKIYYLLVIVLALCLSSTTEIYADEYDSYEDDAETTDDYEYNRSSDRSNTGYSFDRAERYEYYQGVENRGMKTTVAGIIIFLLSGAAMLATEDEGIQAMGGTFLGLSVPVIVAGGIAWGVGTGYSNKYANYGGDDYSSSQKRMNDVSRRQIRPEKFDTETNLKIPLLAFNF